MLRPQPCLVRRNSKLTQILQDSLGNDSKTLLIVTCSPAATNAHESNCSLMFASLAAAVDLSGAFGLLGFLTLLGSFVKSAES